MLSAGDIYSLYGLLSSISVDVKSSETYNKRIESFKKYLNKIVEIASETGYRENLKDEYKKCIDDFMLLSLDFKNDIEEISSETFKGFLDKYNFFSDCELQAEIRIINGFHMDYLISKQNMSELQAFRYNLWNYYMILGESYADITGSGFDFDAPICNSANEYISEINKILDKRANEFVAINVRKYRDVYDDELRCKDTVKRFFFAACSKNLRSYAAEIKCDPSLNRFEDEYEMICKNDGLLKVIVSSQLSKEDSFDCYCEKGIYKGFEGDFTFVIVGFVKAIERFLKEILIQKFNCVGLDFSCGGYKDVKLEGACDELRWFGVEKDRNGEKIEKPRFLELSRTASYIANHLHRDEHVFQKYHSDISDVFDWKKKDGRTEKGQFIFNNIFVKEVRNGHMHVDPVKTSEEAIDLYNKTSFFFRKAIDELMFLGPLR